jgi:hypothetical protein
MHEWIALNGRPLRQHQVEPRAFAFGFRYSERRAHRAERSGHILRVSS